MKYTYEEEKNNLKIKLDEELDMNSCKVLRTIIDGYIMKYSPISCELDMTEVKFMDSSGLGFIMGRYNLLNMLDASLVIYTGEGSIKKIINMSNLGEKIKVM